MNQFQQYYTSELHSKVLVQNLEHANPRSALDLGFGDGNLLVAAKNRWEDIELYGVDIDENNVVEANLNNRIKAIHLDGFLPDLPKYLLDEYGTIDLLISNPPYFSKDMDQNIRSILKESGLNDAISFNIKNIPAELVFLAQNLRLLNDGGEIGIILPAGLISGEKWKELRKYLLESFQINCCVQLPPKSFQKTEAQAFILFIQKNTILKNDKIKLATSGSEKDVFINHEQATQRMDYSFYSDISHKDDSFPTLINSDFKIFRGNTPHLQLKRDSVAEYVHTTKMREEPTIAKFESKIQFNGKIAVKGDILLARVGSRCLGRACLIESGSVPISDCVIVVRAINDEIRKYLWYRLSDKNAASQLQRLSLGVSAKYLTHQIVKDFLLNV